MDLHVDPHVGELVLQNLGELGVDRDVRCGRRDVDRAGDAGLLEEGGVALGEVIDSELLVETGIARSEVLLLGLRESGDSPRALARRVVRGR